MNTLRQIATALLVAGITFAAQAQTVDDYQPDSNGDGCVGMSDLLSLLSVFGSCEAQAFFCGDPVNYQGYDYATVLIGEQCWFAENLRNELYLNGDSILTNLNSDEWENTSSGAVAVYGEGDSYCTDYSPDIDTCDEVWTLNEYGRYYNWHAVDDDRGLCPSGWHVPADGEWTVLTDHLGGEAVAGGQMKTDYDWYDGGNGTNSSGFSGLPGGKRYQNGSFNHAESIGYWWSSSPYTSITSYSGTSYLTSFSRSLWWADEDVSRSAWDARSGLSVRCIQDGLEIPGCTDLSACNYNATAAIDDGSCLYMDCASVCGGDAVLDVCGVCNGPGDIYACGCCDIPEGDCDCEGNQLDEFGVCGGSASGEFQCGDPVSYQCYDYATVLIGEQCWFAENLRNELYLNGDSIPANLNDEQWANTSLGGVAVYGENSSYCHEAWPDGDACDEAFALNEFGRLYNWYAVDDVRGLCPSGWHVPTDGEWMTIEMALGMSEAEANETGWRGTDQGTQMKTTYGWKTHASYEGNGTNSSGFSGLPSGYRTNDNGVGSFGNSGFYGAWWTSSPYGSSGWTRRLRAQNGDVNRGNYGPNYGRSVRCIQDSEE